MSEVGGDLAQAHSFFEQVRRVAVTQGVDGRLGLDGRCGSRQAKAVLDGGNAHRLAGSSRTFYRPFAPAATHGRKDQLRVAMGLPELAQASQHRSRQRHVTVLAALGFADVNAAFGSVNIANAKTRRLTHPQPAGVDQLKDHSESRLMDRRQKPAHFLPAQHDRQLLAVGTAHDGK